MERDSAMAEIEISVVWRGNTLKFEAKEGSTLKELGTKLKEMTDVAPDTIRLLIPQTKRSASTSVAPFSDAHSKLTLAELGISEGRPIRMMGVYASEIQEVTRTATKSEQRIAGFEEEEMRAKRLAANVYNAPRKLPQGPYIFHDFRALKIPGIELNPPSEQALALMHRLASDPGIVAIMNKHRWHVGIMTELAPVGYVGISPKCTLGFNKNFGEEISLRLRTDDLKGFRKYESIKKTLLHELAHMVHSEHDTHFYALNKQLNDESISLDWTKSSSHTLSGLKAKQVTDEYFESYESPPILKLGGSSRHSLADARESAAAAAIQRLENSLSDDNMKESSRVFPNEAEPDPDNSILVSSPYVDNANEGNMDYKDAGFEHDEKVTYSSDFQKLDRNEPDPDDSEIFHRLQNSEPDPDNYHYGQKSDRNEPDPGDNEKFHRFQKSEPDPDDCQENGATLVTNVACSMDGNALNTSQVNMEAKTASSQSVMVTRSCVESSEDASQMEIESNNTITKIDSVNEDENLKRIEESTAAACTRIGEVIKKLKSQVPPTEFASVIKTLSTILRNVLDYPNEEKYGRLRMANPVVQRCIAKYQAALEVLHAVGFSEDYIPSDKGDVESCLVLKRKDPGLLWLARSSLEVCNA